MTWSSTVLLYRHMMNESKKFPNYMFRTYALRRIRDAFEENRKVTDPDVVQKLIQEADANLQIIRRQVIIGNLYKGNTFAMDAMTKTAPASSHVKR